MRAHVLRVRPKPEGIRGGEGEGEAVRRSLGGTSGPDLVSVNDVSFRRNGDETDDYLKHAGKGRDCRISGKAQECPGRPRWLFCASRRRTSTSGTAPKTSAGYVSCHKGTVWGGRRDGSL